MRLATRQDFSAPDLIGKSWDELRKPYIDEAQEPPTKEVLVSLAFLAARESLPSEKFLVGAEHDMFCRELQVMADKLAGEKAKKVGEHRESDTLKVFRVCRLSHSKKNFSRGNLSKAEEC